MTAYELVAVFSVFFPIGYGLGAILAEFVDLQYAQEVIRFGNIWSADNSRPSFLSRMLYGMLNGVAVGCLFGICALIYSGLVGGFLLYPILSMLSAVFELPLQSLFEDYFKTIILVLAISISTGFLVGCGSKIARELDRMIEALRAENKRR
jgi:hypothetical protein